jgi:hypothetical protein
MLRAILFVHRWLGIVVGLIMTIWCLSGFVMMYSPYPVLDPDEQLRGLPALQLPAGGSAWQRAGLADEMELRSARIERMDDRLMLRIVPAAPPGAEIAQMRASPASIDLATGDVIEALPADTALAVGKAFGARFGIDGKALGATPVEIDQWSVQTAPRHQPLHRVDYANGASAYVAGSGEVVQQTTRAERFWGWLGAVPHWLYPTLLRQNGALWTQVVICTSLIGCFLTATGLWVGIARLRRNRQGKIGSPYRGIWWWHHVAGLFFGVLTLSWVASGLFSMNPWGFLESEAGLAERERLAGPMRWGDVRDALERLPALSGDVVRIETAPLGGTIYLAAVSRDGASRRIDAAGKTAPLGAGELRAALADGPRVAALDLLRAEDNYYYGHKDAAVLPVWRATLSDDGQTRLYIDPETGRLIRAVDANGRAFRWLMRGLHSLDLPGLRTRPIWDLVVVPLLVMVTLVCATGTWMGISKVRRDLRRVRNRRRRAARAIAEDRGGFLIYLGKMVLR